MALVLATIPGTTFQLRDDAQASYDRCIAAGCPTGITSAYRTVAEQLTLVAKYKAGTGNFALDPSLSNHVKGIAIDLPGDASKDWTPRGWFHKYARAYGWTPDLHEDWHFNYDPANDQHNIGADMPLTTADADLVVSRLLNYTNTNVSGGDASIYAMLRNIIPTLAAVNATHSDLAKIVESAVAGAKPATSSTPIDTAALTAAIVDGIKAQWAK